MQIGVVFPQTEIGSDVGAIRSYVAAVETFGYRHVLAYDHVLGADPSAHPGWRGPYNLYSTFHEPMVLYGYLAALTSMELVTGIIILPQRQTALAAKQAAQVDLLTAGRFRFGVGLGWNAVEYEALGKSFSDRGRRMEEQVGLLRLLWSQESVSFEGHFETVRGAGIAPLPLQRPIPIWFGAQSPPAYRRAGRLADGWFPQAQPGAGLEEAKEIVDESAREAGRSPDSLGMEGRISFAPNRQVDDVCASVEAWRKAGASHVSVNTMGAGFAGVDAHLTALEALSDELRLRG